MLKSLLLFVLLAVLLAGAQEPTRSCENTRAVFEDLVVFQPGSPSVSDIFPDPQSVPDSQCQMSSTCCSLEVESNFKEGSVREYQTQYNQLKSPLSPCHNHSIFAATHNYFLNAKLDLLDTLSGMPFLSQYFSRETTLFDRFYNYLANSVYTGDLTDLKTEFFDGFFTTYLNVHLSNDLTPDYPDTPAFHQCFYNYFIQTEGRTIDGWLFGFERAYNLTMRYFRALRVVDEVVTAVSRHGISEQCKRSLMRMTHCVHCAGYPASSQSCNGLCVNTMRGCLLDLGDLVQPIEEFTEALLAVHDKMVIFSPYLQIDFFNGYFNRVIGDTDANIYSILLGVQDQCLDDDNRRKRDIPDEVRHRSKRGADQGRVLTPRQILPHPLETLNNSAYCLVENLNFFSNASESMCDEFSVSEGNTECWNGRNYGDYTRDVVAYSRTGQANNPEMLVCTELSSQFSRQISLLRYMAREMRSLTGRCSTDDEDCPEVVPTARYYDLDSLDLSSLEIVEGTQMPDDMEGASGSGAPPTEDVCQESAIPVTTSPLGPGGTDSSPGPEPVNTNEVVGSTSSAGRVTLSATGLLLLACLTVLVGWACL